MFETAELGKKIPKDQYKLQSAPLRARLLNLQRALTGAKFGAMVVLGGVETAGRSELANLLKEWFDVRFLQTHAFGRLGEGEGSRPEYWKYWRTIPPRGSVAIYTGSWYSDPIYDRMHKNIKRAEYEARLSRMAAFEQMLVEDGMLLLKFWLHIPRDEQKRRLKALESSASTKWRVNQESWSLYKRYHKALDVVEEAIRHTDSALTPWFLIEATDDRYRDLTVSETIASAVERRLSEAETEHRAQVMLGPIRASSPPGIRDGKTVLDAVDLSATVDTATYGKRLEKLQEELARLTWEAFEKGVSTVMVFEGWDAAGKGGAIRRVSRAVDARLLRVLSIAAPTDEEKAHHYLWRFWRHIPADGRVTIYDRSWYGRVLVERVEGFAETYEWQRAYREINDFEEQLSDHGTVLLKFWLHISQEEQLRRFKEREVTPWKQHKITEDDWRNRNQWEAYGEAVNEMVARTSTAFAPWHLIAANDKKNARIQVLETVAHHLADRLRK